MKTDHKRRVLLQGPIKCHGHCLNFVPSSNSDCCPVHNTCFGTHLQAFDSYGPLNMSQAVIIRSEHTLSTTISKKESVSLPSPVDSCPFLHHQQYHLGMTVVPTTPGLRCSNLQWSFLMSSQGKKRSWVHRLVFLVLYHNEVERPP